MGEPREYRFGNAQLRPQQRELLVDGKQRQVGARAFDLLLTLVERRDRVVRKDELLDCVWPGVVVEENNLQVHISSLRKLLGPHAIATVAGRGYRFTASLDSSARAPVAPPAPAAGNLPAQAPVLYGRNRELQQLQSIAQTHRILTIVGPGGIGKTVLAHALAHDLAGAFPDGVWLAELATVAEPTLVPAVVAGVLRHDLEHGGVQELARNISGRHLLLVLDNCEHLPQAASELVWALYRDAPHLHVLATSREPLKLAGEHVFRLNGLEVPVPDATAAQGTGAIELFEARVRAADASFALGPGDLSAAAEICRHLDGIPLAIEFAAARVPLFGVCGLREQLDERFRVLTRGTRLAQPRHQTLHAALEWSFTLLDVDQQAVFRRLGVFAGSFGLDSAKLVGGGAAIDEWRVLDHLGDLVDKSLVVAESGEVPRYRLLETTRAFALGKLADAGEVEAARRLHAHAMLQLFESACDDELAVPLMRRLAHYGVDLDNLRAALDWSFGPTGDRALGVSIASASAWVWREGGAGRPEGMRRVQLAFKHLDAQTPALVEARLCLEWCALASPQVRDVELARAQRGVELCRAMGDSGRLALALCQLARTHAHRRESSEAMLAIEEQRTLAGPHWPMFLRARTLLMENCVLFECGDFEAAISLAKRAYQLALTMDDPLLLLHSLTNQEQCAAALGRWEECVVRGRELVALVEQHPGMHPTVDAIVAGNLCMALLRTGAIDEALQQARLARPLFERFGHLVCLLDALAMLAFERGFKADAARIMGCADARGAESGSHRERVEAGLHDELAQRLARTFGPAQLCQLVAEGPALSVGDAASLALRDDPPATQPAWAESSVRAAPRAEQGTHREHA